MKAYRSPYLCGKDRVVKSEWLIVESKKQIQARALPVRQPTSTPGPAELRTLVEALDTI